MLKEIVNGMETLALSHLMIKSFEYGDSFNIQKNGETTYPSMYLEYPFNIVYSEATKTVSFSFYIVDLPSEDYDDYADYDEPDDYESDDYDEPYDYDYDYDESDDDSDDTEDTEHKDISRTLSTQVTNTIEAMSKRRLCAVLSDNFEDFLKLKEPVVKHESGCDPAEDLVGDSFDEMDPRNYVKEKDSSQCWSASDLMGLQPGFENPYTREKIPNNVIEWFKNYKAPLKKFSKDLEKIHTMKARINPIKELGMRVVNQLTLGGSTGYLEISDVTDPGKIERSLDRLRDPKFAYTVSRIQDSFIDHFGVQRYFQGVDSSAVKEWLSALDSSIREMTRADRFEEYRNILYTVLTL